MKLTGEERKQLKEALLSAFNKKQLEMMLSEELDWELNNVAGGSNDSEIVFDLIKYTIKEGKLEELLKAAILRNSGNANLKNFHDHLYANTVTEEEICQLQQLLKKIEKNNFKIIKSAYLQILPDNFQTDNQALCNPENSDTITQILRQDYTKNDIGVPSIVKLAEKIANNIGRNHPIYPDLEIWLQQLQKRLGISISLNSESKKHQEESDSRLVCVILPEAKGYCLNFIHLENEVPKNIDYLIEESKSEVRKGILCSSVENIQLKIDEIIKKFLEKEPDKALEIIEIYLPHQLLYMNVDEWYISTDFDRVPILKEYRIIIHATDRLKPGSTSCNNLLRGWNRLTKIIEANVDILEQIEISNSKSDWNTISGNLRSKIGIKLTEPILEKQTNDFIKAILNGGVPLAFWIRCEPCDNLNLNIINNYLTIEYLENNLDKLIKHVCEVRFDAHNQGKYKDLAYNLGFWCDIPSKIKKIREPVFKPLNSIN